MRGHVSDQKVQADTLQSPAKPVCVYCLIIHDATVAGSARPVKPQRDTSSHCKLPDYRLQGCRCGERLWHGT